jgi:hypothetical protein
MDHTRQILIDDGFRSCKPMNCHPIVAEAEARGVSNMLAFLRDELPRRWMAGYKEATRRPTNILRIVYELVDIV